MSSEKSIAIITGVIDFSESSCVVTMFTRDFGKISALAKGAWRPKGPFAAAIDLLSVCRIVFIRKSSDALDLLTEAKLERRFRAGSRNLSCLYAGYYVAELLNELTDAGDPHPELFQIALDTLTALDENARPAPLVLWFELAALRVLGHLPTLDCCASCGGDVPPAARMLFGQLAGGVLCGECRARHKQVASVSGGAIQTLRRFCDPDGGAWRSMAVDPRVGGEIRGLLNRYIANLIGRPPRMHKYLGALAS